MKILIADDEQAVQDLLGHSLTSQGHELFFVSKGNEVCEAARIHQVDLIFLDYILPNMKADEVIKQLNLSSHIPKVALITGFDIEEVKESIGKHDNIVDFISKPFSLKDVVELCINVTKNIHLTV